VKVNTGSVGNRTKTLTNIHSPTDSRELESISRTVRESLKLEISSIWKKRVASAKEKKRDTNNQDFSLVTNSLNLSVLLSLLLLLLLLLLFIYFILFYFFYFNFFVISG